MIPGEWNDRQIAAYNDRQLANYYGELASTDDEPTENPYRCGDVVGLSVVLDLDGDSVLLSNEDGGEEGAAWFDWRECVAVGGGK